MESVTLIKIKFALYKKLTFRSKQKGNHIRPMLENRPLLRKINSRIDVPDIRFKVTNWKMIGLCKR